MMNEFLASSKYINNGLIQKKAKELAKNCSNDIEIAKNCFEFVRDNIKHSFDYGIDSTVIKAEEVLAKGAAFCYGKSHLLAALLRSNNIASSLCYQNLEDNSGFCLHSFNAVYLKNYGWYKIDARGNNNKVKTEFNPPFENLAYSPDIKKGEYNIEKLYAKPLAIVVEKSNLYDNIDDFITDLPRNE